MLEKKLPQYLLLILFSLAFGFITYHMVSGTNSTTIQTTALTAVMTLTAVALIVVARLDTITMFSGAGLTAQMQAAIQAKIEPIQEEVNDQKTKVYKQEQKIEHQQQIINDLVIYSLAAQPYEILWRLASTPEYIYKNTDNVRRWMNTLLDSGFIQPKKDGGWLEFNDKMHGTNLVEIAKPTPAGNSLLSLRGNR